MAEAVICLLCFSIYLSGFLPGDECPYCQLSELMDIEEFYAREEDIKRRDLEQDLEEAQND